MLRINVYSIGCAQCAALVNKWWRGRRPCWARQHWIPLLCGQAWQYRRPRWIPCRPLSCQSQHLWELERSDHCRNVSIRTAAISRASKQFGSVHIRACWCPTMHQASPVCVQSLAAAFYFCYCTLLASCWPFERFYPPTNKHPYHVCK